MKNNNYYLFNVVIIIFITISIEDVETSDGAKRLYDDLMRRYDQRVRPVLNATDTLNVGISLTVSQLIDVDEKNQIITTNVWLKHEWKDYRLSWNPDFYDNICIMYIPCEQLWLPDIALYNNADGKYHITSKTKATVYPSGSIVWDPPMIYKSSCPINVQYFPFDEQTCSLKLGSWTHHGDQVNLSHIVYPHIEMARTHDNYRVQGVFFRDYYPNGEWDIIRAPAMRNQKRYSCCLQPYYDITYSLVLKRKTLFYTIHLIIPCIGICLLTFIVFYLPSQTGEKIVLSISIELALTVIFPLLADLIPSTSIMMPLLGKYLLFIMILVAFSLVNTVLILAVYYRQKNHSETMPKWMKTIFVQILPAYLFISIEKKNDERSTNEKKRRKKSKNWTKLPKENTLDAIFIRMLENFLCLDEIDEILTKFRTEATHDQNAHDWQRLAFVVDRILLILFTSVSVFGTIAILAQRTGLSVMTVDLNNLDQGVADPCRYRHEL